MAKTPLTDPFYVGPICGDTSGYTPTEEKNLDVVVFPTNLDINKRETLKRLQLLFDQYYEPTPTTPPIPLLQIGGSPILQPDGSPILTRA